MCGGRPRHCLHCGCVARTVALGVEPRWTDSSRDLGSKRRVRPSGLIESEREARLGEAEARRMRLDRRTSSRTPRRRPRTPENLAPGRLAHGGRGRARSSPGARSCRDDRVRAEENLYELRAGIRLARASGSEFERYYFGDSFRRRRRDIRASAAPSVRADHRPVVASNWHIYAVVSHIAGVESKHVLGWLDLGRGSAGQHSVMRAWKRKDFALVPVTVTESSAIGRRSKVSGQVVATVALGVMLPAIRN